MVKYCLVYPKITSYPLDEFGFNFDYYLDIGKEIIIHNQKLSGHHDYSYWVSSEAILGVVLEEYKDSKLVYFWNCKDNIYKTIFPDESILKDSFDNKFTATTGFSRKVSNEYIKEISEEIFINKVVELTNLFKPIGYNYQKEFKIRKYLLENYSLLRLAYAYGLFDKSIIIDNKEFEADWNCWTSSLNKSASSYFTLNNNSPEFTKDILRKLFSKEDFYNLESDFLERIIEQSEDDSDHEDLINILYKEINDFQENPFHKFYSEDEENNYFLLSYNSPEDSYFTDVSEEFIEKIIDALEDKFSVIKEKLNRNQISLNF